MSSVAVVTGVAGQDGQYLAELLLSRGYTVHGVIRPNSTTSLDNLHPNNPSPSEVHHLHAANVFKRELDSRRFYLHAFDLLDQTKLQNFLLQYQPNEYYHLAAMSCVPKSWDLPIECTELNGLATAHALEAIRLVNPAIRFCQAGSSEMFGRPITSPQSELTPFRPRNPYASSKVMAHHLTANYREYHRLFACNAILFNHESPRRGLEFVSRKITFAAAQIKFGLLHELRMGNLEAVRDWGFAGDYVEAMWRMLQQDKADDFVIGTGKSHRVADIVQIAFTRIGLDWEKYVVIDPAFCRPEHGCKLIADPTKAHKLLDWHPQMPFSDLVTSMVDSDLKLVEQRLRDSNRTSDRLVA